MSVLCCHIPEFLTNLTLVRQPRLAAYPLALLGPDERVWAVSAAARSQGIQVEMRPHQAQMHCPDVHLASLDLVHCQAEQQAFLALLAQWGLPVEERGWGSGYVDLHAVAMDPLQVRPLAAELGDRVRRALGASLQPALGWDSGKFTAQAAAICTGPGHMRLVEKADEVRFLEGLSISLLPLPPGALQQLHWLGIRTLGQFARLPPGAVGQRFGTAGRLAQRWAQGKDDRPVQNGVTAAPAPAETELDPPSGMLSRVLAALDGLLPPLLSYLAGRLQGCRHLRLQLDFVEGSTRILDLVFVDPVSQIASLRQTLSDRLSALNWPAEMNRITVAVLAVGELQVRQLALFADLSEQPAPLATLAQALGARYGQFLFQAHLVNSRHPVAERRARLLPLA